MRDFVKTQSTGDRSVNKNLDCDEWYVAGEHAPWSEQLTERFLKAAGKAAGEGFSEKVKRLNVEE